MVMLSRQEHSNALGPQQGSISASGIARVASGESSAAVPVDSSLVGALVLGSDRSDNDPAAPPSCDQSKQGFDWIDQHLLRAHRWIATKDTIHG